MKTIFTFLCAFTFSGLQAQPGNVGIGTATPKAQLHTTGSLKFDTLKGAGRRLVYVTDSGYLYTGSNPVYENNAPFSIPDRNCTGIISAITIAGMNSPVPSANIKVKLNITHTYSGDIELYLSAPNGQILKLKGYKFLMAEPNDNFINTIFCDTASLSIDNGFPPYTGTFKPSNGNVNTAPDIVTVTPCADPAYVTAFSAFGGGSIIPNGIWTLKIIDRGPADVGTLNNWSISFDGSTPGEPDLKSNYIVKSSLNGGLITGSIYDNGNVGIGTATPTEKLDVVGTVKATAFSGDGSTLSNVVNTTAAQNIGGAKTFSSTVAAPSFSGDGSTLTNVMNTTAAQTISGAKTFSSAITAPSFSGDGSMLSNVVNTTAAQTIGGNKTFASPLNATSYITPGTGAANMVAVAYGNIVSTGTIATSSGSANYSINHATGSGSYTITFNSPSSLFNFNSVANLPIVATLFGGTPGFISYSGGSGVLIIYTFNSSGVATDRGFSFVVYKP